MTLGQIELPFLFNKQIFARGMPDKSASRSDFGEVYPEDLLDMPDIGTVNVCRLY